MQDAVLLPPQLFAAREKLVYQSESSFVRFVLHGGVSKDDQQAACIFPAYSSAPRPRGKRRTSAANPGSFRMSATSVRYADTSLSASLAASRSPACLAAASCS